MEEQETLRKHLISYLDDEQLRIIEDACLLGKKAHEGQKRHTGEPYITHPLAVATILAEMRMDPPTIIAAILHDVLEDTSVEKQDLIDQFGKEIADLVDGVTKLTQIEFETRAEAQAENFRKMVMAMARDIRVILIKLADRLHNMRTISSLPRKKRRRIAKETLEIFAPIANRLGMHAFRVEFEDLGFSALYPMRYRILKDAVNKAHGNRQEMMETIDQEIQKNFLKNNIRARSLTNREKHLYSIYKKMHDKHLSFSEVMDVYGFRVIVDKVDTCYRVLGALHGIYKPITQRFKDYIAIPKANGYQSLHTTLFGPYGVPIEVQIRTEEMHKMAEYGISAHWLYKTEKSVFGEAQLRAKEWLKGVLEMHKSSKNSLEFIENVKIDLFPDEVYVFTPKGTILELPQGATPVDFAYAIHSDIGNTCVATKLDRRLAPLSTHLTNGQQVEIITAAGARPNPAWLSFVVTGKARSNIKHFLKKQKREESIELGKRLVEKSLHGYGLALSQISNEQIELVVKAAKLESINHLFEEVGIGNRTALLAAKQLAKIAQLSDKTESSDTLSHHPLAIKGTEGIVVVYAKCCRPIPGDPVGGITEAGHGLVVHVEHCPALEEYRNNPDKYVPLHWENKVPTDFPVDLRIDILNQRGSLASLALGISEVESNIENINAEEFDGRYISVNLTVTTRDRIHLARILRKIRNNKNVIRITRQKPRIKKKRKKKVLRENKSV
ncbi:MAG: bifunctional GTP diphosphokinase/guanosine-3',5'-bis pyrophosphate 3'-pyrophosphohydrolase [Gammaproteobacteria bacterium]|nr:bifunctional GTP diphosphokinase/guanosine-3',5'-bis pyrophosphate 3'-pyrophosphohydrolase [Gammaproteobacteria bacterium]